LKHQKSSAYVYFSPLVATKNFLLGSADPFALIVKGSKLPHLWTEVEKGYCTNACSKNFVSPHDFAFLPSSPQKIIFNLTSQGSTTLLFFCGAGAFAQP